MALQSLSIGSAKRTEQVYWKVATDYTHSETYCAQCCEYTTDLLGIALCNQQVRIHFLNHLRWVGLAQNLIPWRKLNSWHLYRQATYWIEIMQLTSRSGYFPSHKWQNSGGFYSNLRNKSSRETCMFSASTTVILNTLTNLLDFQWNHCERTSTNVSFNAPFRHSKSVICLRRRTCYDVTT